MSIGIKNGKHLANNIHKVKLIFLFIALNIPPDSATATATGIDKNWVIVIDAGHGGRDPGALGASSYEKNITLAIALKTGEYIEKNIKNVNVIYTRKTDTSLELRERPNIANKNKADLFISIHANWAESKSIHGTETYIMGLAKDQQNLEVAMKENEVILWEDDYSTKYEGFDPKSPESYVMFTLMQNIYHEQSKGLASDIQTQFRENINRTDRGVKQAGFWVLFNTTMPSVLTETGFITNAAEEKFLKSEQGQDYIASAIFRACRAYIAEIDSKSVIVTDKKPTPEPKPDISIPVARPAEEIHFRVQIAGSSAKIDVKPENFKGLSDIVEIVSGDYFRYATGIFSDYPSAFRYREKMEKIYPDAFVIAVKDNKILPLQQALEQIKNKK
jgi:N-acetylmuramoyl-L-alanine amidase